MIFSHVSGCVKDYCYIFGNEVNCFVMATIQLMIVAFILAIIVEGIKYLIDKLMER